MPNIMLSWQQSALLGIALAVVGLALRAARGHRFQVASVFAVEAALIAALYTVWQYVANRSVSDRAEAIHNAQAVAHAERWLHMPPERSVQDLVLHHSLIVQAANVYYDTMHFTIMFVFLLWLFFRHRDRYRPVRTVLATSTLACLVISFVPVAPPRLLAGYVDTAMLYGESVYSGPIANELSAMPSVHVAWCVLIAWYAMRIGRSRWRLLAPAHAVITVFVIVATANHWWLDGVVAVAVLCACAYACAGISLGWSALRPRALAGVRRHVWALPRQRAASESAQAVPRRTADVASTTTSPESLPCTEPLLTAPACRSDEITRVASDDR